MVSALSGACSLSGDSAWGTDASFVFAPGAPAPIERAPNTEPAVAVGISATTWRDSVLERERQGPVRALPATLPGERGTLKARPKAQDADSSREDPEPKDSQDQALLLPDLLDSVSRTYPELSVAEQGMVLARARQLAALGNFDLSLKAFGTSSPEGFFQNDTAGLTLEQPLGVQGATVYGGYRIGSGDFDPTFDGKRLTNDGGEFAAGVRMSLLRGGSIDRRRAEVFGANIDRDIAGANAADVRLVVTFEASRAYWRWVAAGRRLEIAEALLQLADERQDGIATRVRRGDLPEIEQLDNQRLVVRRRGLVIAARRNLEGAALTLSLFLRDANGQPVLPLRERLPAAFPIGAEPLSDLLADDVRRALRQRPDLQQLKREVDKVRLQARLFENDTLPQLDLTVEGSQDLDDDDPTPTKGEFELFVGMELTLSVQNRGAIGRLQEARARMAQISARMALARDRIATQVRDAFSEMLATHERVEQSGIAASLADTLAQKELRNFELGEGTVLVLNLREEAAAEAKLALADSLRAYWTAVAQYRVAVGEDSARSHEDR